MPEASRGTMRPVARSSMVGRSAVRGVGAFAAGLTVRLRVKDVRLRGKTEGASFCFIRFGTLVCYTAVCFS